jgi:hypothetical protein
MSSIPNGRSQELWRELAGREDNEAFRGWAQSGVLAADARISSAFARPRLGLEKVAEGGIGGGDRIRTCDKV